MMNKKNNIRIAILIITLIALCVGIYIVSKPKNSDYVMGNDMDSAGNIYTLSYDEDNVYLKKINSNQEILWTSKFPKIEGNYINTSHWLTVTPEGKVIMYLYKYDVTTYKKVSEQMYLYSNDGKNKTLILDDRIDLGGERTIYSIHSYDDELYFFQISSKRNPDDNFQLIDLKKINLNSILNGILPEAQIIKTIKYDDIDIGINNIIYTRDNSIIFTTYDSKIYKVNENNKNEQIYPLNNDENKGISGISCDSEDNIYFENIATDEIMTINLTTKKVSTLYDDNSLKNLGINFSRLKKVEFISKNKFYGIQSLDSKNNVVSVFDNNHVQSYKELKYSNKVLFERCGFTALGIILILGLILGVIKITKRYTNNKLTISLKQMFVFIPIISISIVIILIVSNDKMTSILNQQLIEQIYAVSRTTLDDNDINLIKNINWSSPYKDARYQNLRIKLGLDIKDNKIYNYIEQNNIKDPHNSIYKLLYTIKGNEIYTGICDLNYDNIPINYIYSDEDTKVYEKALKEKTFVYTKLNDSVGEWLALICPIVDSNNNVVALLEVGITKQGFVKSMISNNLKDIVTINSLIGITMIVSLLICLNYLLLPLKRLKNAVMELSDGNLGVQVVVKSNDEVAEISEVFNKMSRNLKIDMEKLTRLNDAYHRFVPLKMFEILNKKNILDVRIGDQVKTNISLLSLTTNNFKELSYRMNTSEIFVFINKIFNILVPIINEQEGVVERYNNSGLISLFPTNLSDSVKSAIKMKEYIRNDKDEKIRNVDLGFVINKEDIMVGIIGCEERFGASVVSDYLTIVESLNEFGKKYGTSILVTENSVAEAEEYGESYNYRKLGYIKYKSKDQVIALYDFFDGDDYNIIARKKQTKEIFEQAVKAYYNRDFYNARQMFIQVLKQFQEDKASKEYLRLCDKYYKFKEYENIDIWLDLF